MRFAFGVADRSNPTQEKPCPCLSQVFESLLDVYSWCKVANTIDCVNANGFSLSNGDNRLQPSDVPFYWAKASDATDTGYWFKDGDTCSKSRNGVCDDVAHGALSESYSCGRNEDTEDCFTAKKLNVKSDSDCPCLSECVPFSASSSNYVCVVPKACANEQGIGDQCTILSGSPFNSDYKCDKCRLMSNGVEPSKMHTNWSDYDVPIYSHRWSDASGLSTASLELTGDFSMQMDLAVEVSITYNYCGMGEQYEAGQCWAACISEDFPIASGAYCYQACPENMIEAGDSCFWPADEGYSIYWSYHIFQSSCPSCEICGKFYKPLCRPGTVWSPDCNDCYPQCMEPLTHSLDDGRQCFKTKRVSRPPGRDRPTGFTKSFLPEVIVMFDGAVNQTISLTATALGEFQRNVNEPVPGIEAVLKQVNVGMALGLGPLAFVIRPKLGFNYAFDMDVQGYANVYMGIAPKHRLTIGYNSTAPHDQKAVFRASRECSVLGPDLLLNVSASARLALIPQIGVTLLTILDGMVNLQPYLSADFEGTGRVEREHGLWHLEGSACAGLQAGLDAGIHLDINLWLVDIDLLTAQRALIGPQQLWRWCGGTTVMVGSTDGPSTVSPKTIGNQPHSTSGQTTVAPASNTDDGTLPYNKSMPLSIGIAAGSILVCLIVITVMLRSRSRKTQPRVDDGDDEGLDLIPVRRRSTSDVEADCLDVRSEEDNDQLATQHPVFAEAEA